MPLFTSHPIRTIRIEPRPDVGAFYDKGQAWTERLALGLAIFAFACFAAQMVIRHYAGTL